MALTRVGNGIDRIVRAVLFVLLAAALIGAVVFAPFIEYEYMVSFALPNVVLLVLGFLLCAAVVCVVRPWKDEAGDKDPQEAQKIQRVAIVLIVVLCALQIFNFRAYLFEAGWDAGYMSDIAWSVVSNNPQDEIDDAVQYLSIYPNNLFIVWIYAQVMRVVAFLAVQNLMP